MSPRQRNDGLNISYVFYDFAVTDALPTDLLQLLILDSYTPP
jgi:hypothetical protein